VSAAARFKILCPGVGHVVVTVDAGEAYRLRAQAWSVRYSRKSGYTVYRSHNGETLTLARLLGPARDGERTLFLNGNALDLRRCNLRAETCAQRGRLLAASRSSFEGAAGVCRRGHRMTPDNVQLYSGGKRRCLACVRERAARKKAAAPG